MKIELITPEEHAQLLSIYNEFSALRLQNKGYEYIDKSKLSPEALEQHKIVTDLLSKKVAGFREFSNFLLDKNGAVAIRLQYNYNYNGGGLPFTGVGYILVDQLLKGFE